MNIEEFNFLWTTKKEDYVLVNTEHGYGIVDKKEKRVLCISDENLSQAVIQKMIAEGTKICTMAIHMFEYGMQIGMERARKKKDYIYVGLS